MSTDILLSFRNGDGTMNDSCVLDKQPIGCRFIGYADRYILVDTTV
ncbi:hypothetical protein [Candidatus Nitrotoga sp. BS]|nr:hypothetical protein [Candidatus Nitrotoga sp. BS]